MLEKLQVRIKTMVIITFMFMITEQQTKKSLNNISII